MNAKKKAGIVGAGVLTAVVLASPLAWATDGGEHGHHGGAGKACQLAGGDGAAGSEISGGALANVVAQAPVAGNNIGNIGNCSDFLNGNLNGNLSGNAVSVLGGPAVPAVPGIPAP